MNSVVSVMATFLCCLVCMASDAGAEPPSYIIADLGAIGGQSGPSFAHDLNEVGQVISSDTLGRAAWWTDGSLRELERPNNLSIHMGAINDFGFVAGTAVECTHLPGGDISCTQYLVAWHDGRATTLGTFASGDGHVEDINNLGQIVGGDFTGNGRGFLWHNGDAIEIHPSGAMSSWASGINNLGQVIGNFRLSSSRTHAFLWEDGTVTDLGAPGGFNSQANGINDKSQIVGSYSILGGGYVGFLWEDGMMSDLPAVSGHDWSVPVDINHHGQIVGFSRNSSAYRAVVWTDGEIWKLNDLVLDGSGWILESASGINDEGQIAGYGINPAGSRHAYLLTPVPEPAVIVLLAAGAVSVFAYRRFLYRGSR